MGYQKIEQLIFKNKKMTRQEFLKMAGIIGFSLPFQSVLSSCDDGSTDFSGKVIVIGAGAAGLLSAYLLKQQGIECTILEASAVHGGRLKRTVDFADFPIPLGAEWLHTGTEVFEEIVNDSTVAVNVNTVGYNTSDSYGVWEDGALTLDEIGTSEDRKFVNSTWFDFFETYIVPSVASSITYNAIVKSIDYSGEQILVNTANEELTADKVIITVPLKILQAGDIAFTPQLPSDKQTAIDEASVWEGLKVFFEFSQQFYPTVLDVAVTPETDGEKVYFDAAYGQNTTKHILGFFVIGKPALPLISMTDNDLKNYILNELDTIFSNQATPSYVKHVVQNWSTEPFIKGAYLNDYEEPARVKKLAASVASKLYFAGEAYTSGDDWGGAHAAAQSAQDAVLEVLK